MTTHIMPELPPAPEPAETILRSVPESARAREPVPAAGSVFRPATAETLRLLQTFNQEKRCTFLISSNYMHEETAKLGYLLSSLVGQACGRGGTYRTFFVNSAVEALSGAIKLARQTSVRQRKPDDGWVLLVDPRGRFQPFLDPTGKGSEDGATPHIGFTSSAAEALNQVDKRSWSALVYVRYAGAPADEDLSRLVAAARARGALVVACDSELELTDAELTGHRFAPDVVVHGENLTARQVPFGCFTMTEAAHAVWNNDTDCFAQTATFGGNRLCAAAAVAAMDRNGLVSDVHRQVFARIDGDFATMLEYWGRHVNPGMAALAGIFGMDMRVREASGGRLRTGDGREILDCSGGFGTNLRGHNPPDVPALLARHEPGRDYFAELEKQLITMTKFHRAFPAVSGATAVDLAVTLALMANPRRKKVVTFTGNFSGKTLFSLNLSKHGPQLTESDTDAFRPYYAHLQYIDPFAPDAEAQLAQVLRGGDVALVWFEMIRGGMCEALPPAILALVDRLKTEGGYLIGVDEVLTGGWRTGETYLAHQNTVRGADVISLGKTMSDMTVPVATALVSEEVYIRARKTNPDHVERLRHHYRNNLSAQISVNALTQVAEPAEQAALVRNQRIIEEGLRALVASNKLFSSVAGRGGLLLLVMNKKYFPFHHRSKPGNLLEMAMSHLIFVRCGVFCFLLRFLHRVVTDERDAREVISRLQRGLAGVKPFMVYRYALSRILSPKLPRLASLIAGRIPRPVSG